MTADEENERGGRSAGGWGDERRADPVRDLLLGLAAQIDQLASMFGGGRARAATDGFGGAERFDGGDASGEITSLIAEIGDLLARLIAALIAVLEAVAAALRSTPADPRAPRHYQPIAVRIDPSGPVPPRRADDRLADPEGEK